SWISRLSLCLRERQPLQERRAMTNRLAFAMSVSIALLLVSPAAAQAGPGSARQQHCIAQALPAFDSGTSTIRCFSTFAGAINAATSGRVTLRNATSSREV